MFLAQMRGGKFEMARKVHQDMDPKADEGRWWLKILAITLVGALWITAAIAYLVDPAKGLGLVKLAVWALVAEQVMTPMLSPRYWKSYTGIGVGFAFYFLVLHLI